MESVIIEDFKSIQKKEKKKVDKPIIINSEPIPKEGSSNLNL
jgi:hypothetical protein